MKYCVNCGKEIKEEANFCPFCGTTQPGREKSIPKAEIAEKGRNYFNYLNKNVAHPLVGLTSDKGVFGLVNFGLTTLFLSLALSHGIARGMQTINYTGNFPALFEFLLLIAGILLTNVVINFFVARQVYQEPISFLESFDRMMAPASLVVYLSFALLLFSFIVNMGTLVLFTGIFSFAVLLLNIAFYGNIWMNQDLTGRRNRYYINLVAIIVQLILLVVIYWIFASMIANKVGTGIESFFNNFYNFY